MNPANLAYLVRYALMVLIFLATLLLLRKAMGDFRGGLRRNIKPTFGFFLMVPPDEQAPRQRVRSLPLFHTTVIGRHRNCDIRLHSPSVAGRHAAIYLYDGDWYLQPMRPGLPVTIDGIELTQATPLRNGDRLGFGDINLVFVDEREASADQGLTYSVPYEQLELELRRKPVASPFGWLTICALCAAMTAVFAYCLSGDLLPLRRPFMLVMGSFFLIFNLYDLILPRVFRYCDRIVLLAVTQLCYLGIIIQLRLTLLWPEVMDSAVEAASGNPVRAMVRLIAPQMLALALGLILFPVVIAVVAKTRFIEAIFKFCLVATPLMLLLTLVFGGGNETHGATLWIQIGGFSLQLTEFSKLTYLIVLATFFKTRPPLRTQIRFAAWAAGVMFLIMMLPDLGSIMILLPVTLVVYVVMTSEYLTTLGILAGGSALSFMAYAMFPHVRSRLSGWTTLWKEVNDSNRQIVYGLQAMARGGLFGRGIGNGSPDGIPVVASDMVFTVFCEELGLIAGLCVVVLFIIIWLRGAKNMMLVKDGFTSSLILAVSTMFFIEAALVIAGCTGLMPLTGVTLPFISQGGSSLLAKLLLTGVLVGLMARRTEMAVKR